MQDPTSCELAPPSQGSQGMASGFALNMLVIGKAFNIYVQLGTSATKYKVDFKNVDASRTLNHKNRTDRNPES
jgi:hypothetical protein